jgi:medium-chain acyl-[acyl-carrier-protein] hydrolase
MELKANRSDWVIFPQPKAQARLRLFCFPYAGGGAASFRKWAVNLPSEIEICLVQLPGRETRLFEPAFTRLPPLINTLVDVLRPYLAFPFALFGHSMGALIAFELARHLRRQNWLTPLHLFVAGCAAPQISNEDSPISQLPMPEFIAELRRLNGTPEAVLQHAELMQLLLPTLRADFSVCETYIYYPEAPLACSISAFGGIDDVKVTLNDLAAWAYQTQGPFWLHTMPGDHFFPISAQTSLLGAVSQDLRYLLQCIT